MERVLDGALVLTPPPGFRHQSSVLELAALLHTAARPVGLRAAVVAPPLLVDVLACGDTYETDDAFAIRVVPAELTI